MSFLPYEQHQQLLLPPNIGDLVPEKDLCRVINGFVDSLPRCDVEDIFRKETGAPPYHPRMMLKVILYAYTQKIYSCRQIAKRLRQNVCFMWLSGMQQPSFNTVNRFRTTYFSEMLPRVFSSLCELLLKKSYICREEYFVDGTTIEADAGKYTYVWRKNVERYKKAVQQRARQIIETADRINEHEDELYGEGDLPERGEEADLTAAEIRQYARKLSESRNSKVNKVEKRLEKEVEKLADFAQQVKSVPSQSELDLD